MSEDAKNAEQGVEERTFQTEVQQVLNLLIHSLYTHSEIFLRELISNASDALDKVHHRSLTDKNIADPDAELEIDIEISKSNKTLTIRDSGIGMTRDEVNQNIGTIAHSGSVDFLKKLAESKDKSEQEQLRLIGQFGVGFYSVFMVANRVVLTTRSADPDAEAVMWESTGDGKYTLAPADKKERGTEIKIFVRSDFEEYLDAHRIEGIIHRHSDFVAYPIKVAGKQVNNTSALWTRPRNEITDEQYNEFFTHLTGDPDAPLARRTPNGYRDYDEADVSRVRFVSGARHLGFSLDDSAEILALRDRREAPCRVVLDKLQAKAGQVAHRIAELQRLEIELRELHALGLTFPIDDVDGKNCVCHLVSELADA